MQGKVWRAVSVLLSVVVLVAAAALPAVAADPSAAVTAAAGDTIAAVAAKAKPSVVGILTTVKATRSTQNSHAAGTGWVYKDGVIITN
ncbi:MAG TPA: hypothetical protein VK464_04350, partial [Symbiobacteriaceae bacterium]|nr:hypothetical protein [Symbiobacteriaceae bacterium]